MILVIKNGRVIAQRDTEDLHATYPESEGFEIIEWDGPLSDIMTPDAELKPDPRTPEQRNTDRQEQYKQRRRREYPDIEQLITLLYQDMKNGTDTFVNTIDAIHSRHPRS